MVSRLFSLLELETKLKNLRNYLMDFNEKFNFNDQKYVNFDHTKSNLSFYCIELALTFLTEI